MGNGTMKDVMIDIETLGTSIDCIILSIAAVEFDRFTGEINREFYEKIKPQHGQGRELSFDTLKWWANQPSGAFSEAMSGRDNLSTVIWHLSKWWNQFHWEHFCWSQGTDFDIAILEHAFKTNNYYVPWKYNAKRDTRTAYDVCGFDPKSIEREGTYHNALDDCKHQVKCVVAAINSRAVAS